MKNAIIFLIFTLFLFTSFAKAATSPCADSRLGEFPLQAGGRVRPLKLHAKERIKFISGKSSLQNRDALEIYCILSLQSAGILAEEKIDLPIRVNHAETRKLLGLNEDAGEILLNAIRPRIEEMRSRAETLKERGEDSAFAKDLSATAMRAILLEEITSGNDWTLPISHDEGKTTEWITFSQWHAASSLSEKSPEATLAGMTKLTDDFRKSLGDEYLRELTYDRLHLFHVAMIFVLLALAFSQVSARNFWPFAFTITTLLVEITAMIFRVMISGRAPVTNMYETVMWAGFSALLVAAILTFWKKENIFLKAGLTFNLCCLFLMTFATDMLDPTIRPLVPVLRDNFWLSTHVTSVTLSYAALALSWLLANYAMLRDLKGASDPSLERRIGGLCHDAIKVGVVFLALGIILGGVWADYSWGRFWGWDPKETWSLIALLTYMAVLHGRLAGWIPPVRFIPLVALSFLSIIMAWFGVNYVLAAGLHSYGFSEGGTAFVLGLIGGQIALIGLHQGSRLFKTRKIPA